MTKKKRDVVEVTMPGVIPGENPEFDKILQELADAIQAELNKEVTEAIYKGAK